MLAGADAPGTDYTLVQQRDGYGKPVPPMTMLLPGEKEGGRVYTQTERLTIRGPQTRWRTKVFTKHLTTPVFLTYGRELRLTGDCARGLYQRLKANFMQVHQSGFRAVSHRQ